MTPERTRIKAFAYYLAMENSRTYTAVAKKFKVSHTAVSTWAEEDEWAARVKQADLNISNELNSLVPKLVEGIILDTKESIKLICTQAIAKWKENLDADLVSLSSAKDLSLLVKTFLLVSGEATNITKDLTPIQAKANEIIGAVGGEEDDGFGDGPEEFN